MFSLPSMPRLLITPVGPAQMSPPHSATAKHTPTVIRTPSTALVCLLMRMWALGLERPSYCSPSTQQVTNTRCLLSLLATFKMRPLSRQAAGLARSSYWERLPHKGDRMLSRGLSPDLSWGHLTAVLCRILKSSRLQEAYLVP